VTLIEGNINMTRTMNPKPPSQWVRLLQKSIEYGSISTFAIIEEPVVVKPELDSKKASMKEGIVPLRIYGRVPNTRKINHDSTTIR
jgi:hypothetical protein